MHDRSQQTEPSSSLRNSLSLTLKSDRRLGSRTPRLPAEPISRWGRLLSLERASQPSHTANVVYIPGVCSTHEQFQLCEWEAAVCSQGSDKRVPRFANVQYNILYLARRIFSVRLHSRTSKKYQLFKLYSVDQRFKESKSVDVAGRWQNRFRRARPV